MIASPVIAFLCDGRRQTESRFVGLPAQVSYVPQLQCCFLLEQADLSNLRAIDNVVIG